MVVQTVYSATHAVAYAGMIADGQLKNTISKRNADSVIIPYGKGVVTSGEDAAKLPVDASPATAFIGVTMYETNRAQSDGDVAGAVLNNFFTVITEGAVWVKAAADTIVKDEPVYLRVGTTNPGDFSNVVGAGVTLGVLIPNAKFLTGGDTGDLVKVSLGLGG